jgi:hypothetical protein
MAKLLAGLGVAFLDGLAVLAVRTHSHRKPGKQGSQASAPFLIVAFVAGLVDSAHLSRIGG